MRYLYLTLFLGMAWLPAFAQTELSEEDKREIKAEAKRVVETHLSDLLNTVASNGMGEQGRKLIMANSFIPSENQIFDINSIIEDDTSPEFTINKKGADVKVQRYLENLNLFYTKSEQNSITISEVNVTDVRQGQEYPYVLVHYKVVFSNLHRNKPNLKYVPVLRTAELRAEKVDKQWKVLITGIRYFKAPVAEAPVAKVAEKPAKPAPKPTKTAVTQKPKEEKKQTEPAVAVTPTPVKTEQPAVVTTPKAEPAAPEKKPEVVRAAEKSPEIVPQKMTPAIQELELKVAKYKKQATLFRVAAGAAVVGAAATFVITNGAYGDYKSQIDKTNADFETWYAADGHGANFGDVNDHKAKPKSLIEFGSPGIYFVGAGVIAGGVLWFMGSGSNKKARDFRNQLEQKRKQLSITPQLSGAQRYAGLHIRYRF